MDALYTLDDLGLDRLRNRRVLVRVDFNVPLADGEVMDATRLIEALPTVRELSAAGARVILASHCGRPKGQRVARYSLRPVADKLADLLGAEVAFAGDCIGAPALEVIEAMAPGAVCLLENLRFHEGETANDPAFVGELAKLAEIYVDNAFGTAHRAHASVVGVAERLEHRAAGRLIVRELEALGHLLGEPARPFVGILGGAKVSDKIATLENLLPRLDVLLVGGGMANTFLAARGHDLRDSLVEQDRIEVAGDILERAAAGGPRVVLPVDLVVADDLNASTWVETVAVDAVPEGGRAFDIGRATQRLFEAECAAASTLFWNGPLGVFEKPPFDAGTQAVADSLEQTAGFTVIGGGETVAAVRRAGVIESLSHVSTGGGASLAFLAGKKLPGVAVLEKTS